MPPPLPEAKPAAPSPVQLSQASPAGQRPATPSEEPAAKAVRTDTAPAAGVCRGADAEAGGHRGRGHEAARSRRRRPGSRREAYPADFPAAVFRQPCGGRESEVGGETVRTRRGDHGRPDRPFRLVAIGGGNGGRRGRAGEESADCRQARRGISLRRSGHESGPGRHGGQVFAEPGRWTPTPPGNPSKPSYRWPMRPRRGTNSRLPGG